jgi:hypothetical protein
MDVHCKVKGAARTVNGATSPTRRTPRHQSGPGPTRKRRNSPGLTRTTEVRAMQDSTRHPESWYHDLAIRMGHRGFVTLAEIRQAESQGQS